MRAALRYRRGQAIALLLLAALVATCAAFAPTYARAVDQALLRSIVGASDDGATTTHLSRSRPPGEPDLGPEALVAAIPPALADLGQEPVRETRTRVDVVPKEGKKASPVVLRSRSHVCDHLEVDGRCAEEAGELIVSAKDATTWGWSEGTTLLVPQAKHDRFDPDAKPLELRVVGTYTARDDPGYWVGNRPDGKSGVPQPDLDNLPGVDDLITAEESFAGTMPTATVVVDLPLDRSAVTLDTLPAAVAGVEELRAKHPEISVDQPLTRQLEQLQTGRGQTAVIVPLVMTQLGLLAAIALYLVARGAVDQRRHDLALARLRGRSGAAARRLVLAELGTCAVVGVPLGLVVGVLAAWAAAATMLPDGVPPEVPSAVAAWGLGALAVALAAIVLATRGVHREAVASLLRAARPRRGSGGVELGLGVLALAGVAGVALGALAGPVTLVAPVLAAVALGLLAAALLPRLTARLGARAARRGAVVPALTAHGVGRRPGARRVLLASTVGVALAVFATTCVVVADGNRLARAELETGAPVVVDVAAGGPRELVALADAVRDEGVAASPVVALAPSDPKAPRTLAVDPATLPSVANPSALRDVPLAPIATPEQEPIRLTGERLTGSVSWDLTVTNPADWPKLFAGTARLRLQLTTSTGQARLRDVADIDLRAPGTTKVDVPLLCDGECRLAALVLTWSTEPGTFDQDLEGDVTVSDLAVDSTPVPLGDETTWAEVEDAPTTSTGTTSEGSGDGASLRPTEVSGDRLVLEVRSHEGADASIAVTDVPRPLPVVTTPGVVGSVRPELVTILAPDGLQVPAVRRDVATVMPQVTDRGVLVGLPTLARAGGVLDSRARSQLWLADTSPEALATVERVARDRDVPVRGTTTTAQAERAFDESASGWGLRLAALAGGIGLLLAALVTVITAVTDWRRVVRDGAALLLSGVRARQVRTAVVREQVVTSLVAVLLGTLAGLVGARLALPSVPLFVDGVLVPEPSTAIPWLPVALTVLAALVVLGGTALVVGRSLAARTRPDAAQEVA